MTRGIVCNFWPSSTFKDSEFWPKLESFWGFEFNLFWEKHTSCLEGKSFKGAYEIRGSGRFLDTEWFSLNSCAELCLSESETYILNFLWNTHGYKNVGKGGLARCILPNLKCLKNNLRALRFGKSFLVHLAWSHSNKTFPLPFRGTPYEGAPIWKSLSLEFCHYMNAGVETEEEIVKICILMRFPGNPLIVMPLWYESNQAETIHFPCGQNSLWSPPHCVICGRRNRWENHLRALPSSFVCGILRMPKQPSRVI